MNKKCFKARAKIKSINLNSDITIWYAKISDLISLILNKNIDNDFKVKLNTKFVQNDFKTPLFSNAEIETINNFKALKKQIEWITSRYLTKNMAKHFLLKDTPLNKISLLREEKGAPFFENLVDIHTSLSHSNDYTIAALSKNKNIGIDIEKIRKKPDADFMKIAFTKNERLEIKDTAESIFKHWTIKEAYLKYIKKGFHENLYKVEVINNEIFHNQKKVKVNIYSTLINKTYILSIVYD